MIPKQCNHEYDEDGFCIYCGESVEDFEDHYPHRTGTLSEQALEDIAAARYEREHGNDPR